MTYDRIRANFLRKLWTWQMVKKAVNVVITETEFKEILHDGVSAKDQVITEAQYKDLTGEVYMA